MPFRQGSAKIVCIAVQLLALLLLQGAFLMPAFLKMAQSPAAGRSCYGNHRLCGCPAERVADRTCCCFRALPSCCHGDDAPGAPDGNDAETGTASLRNSPCGLFTGSDMLSFADYEFLAASLRPMINARSGVTLFPACPQTQEDRLCEPPDPPPRVVIHV